MKNNKLTDGDSGVKTESFFDIVDISSKDNIYDSISEDVNILDDLAKKELSKGMLQKILTDTQDVLGGYGDSLRDDTTTIASKINQIQKLEEVSLAESVKAFSTETIDEERLRASSYLMKIAQTLKGTINLKHRLQLQEDIDFLHPKVSKAMSFLIEVFIQTIQENGVEEEQTLMILEAMEVKTFQYAEVMQSIFKGVAISEVPNITNPFLTSAHQYEEMDYIDIYAEPTEDVDIMSDEEFNKKVSEYREKLKKDPAISKAKLAAKVTKYKRDLRR